MKKILLRKKACYVNLSVADEKQLRLIFNELLNMRFYHYYFDNNKLNWKALFVLVEMKKKCDDIKIFVVHDSKLAHYQQDFYINLPILVEKQPSEITTWLEKYCDDILNDGCL